MQVNLSFETRRAILKRMKESEVDLKSDDDDEDGDGDEHAARSAFTPGLFDNAAAEVKKLAKSNCWPQFQMIMVELSHAESLFKEWKRKEKIKRLKRYELKVCISN